MDTEAQRHGEEKRGGWLRPVWCFVMLWVCVFGLVGCGLGAPEPEPTPTLSAELRLGKQVFAQECGSCHSVVDEAVIVGPSMQGIASRGAKQVPGQDARTYLYGSILHPSDYVVEGFNDNIMPKTFGKQLTGEELDAVVAYLLTFE